MEKPRRSLRQRRSRNLRQSAPKGPTGDLQGLALFLLTIFETKQSRQKIKSKHISPKVKYLTMKFCATLALFACLAQVGSAGNLRVTNEGKRGLIVDGSASGEGDGIKAFAFFSNGGCAGVLIDNDRVLTTASCVYGENADGAPDSVYIGATTRFGLEDNPDLYTEEVPVSCAQTYPGWDPEGVTAMGPNDLAVVKLAEEPACIASGACTVIPFSKTPTADPGLAAGGGVRLTGIVSRAYFLILRYFCAYD
jgi:hypothetical protein